MSSRPSCDRPKPVMRHMHRAMSLRNVALAVMASALCSTTFYMVFIKRRRRAFKYFYENYDPDKSFERIMAGGYLSSCQPEPAEPPPEEGKKK